MADYDNGYSNLDGLESLLLCWFYVELLLGNLEKSVYQTQSQRRMLRHSLTAGTQTKSQRLW